MSSKPHAQAPPGAASPGPRQFSWTAPMAGLLFLVVLAGFWPALSCGYVWDDQYLLLFNGDYRGLTPDHLRWMFSTLYFGHYQPLVWLTYSWDYRLWGFNPSGYHFTSLVWHGANAVLFYFLLRALLGCVPALAAHRQTAGFSLACLVGALFFALHPLRVESVVWLTERRDVVCGFFYLLTLLAWLRARAAGGGGKWFLVSLLCYIASFLGKSWGLTLPAVLLALDYYPLRRFEGAAKAKTISRLVGEKIPFVVVAMIFALPAWYAQDQYSIRFLNHDFSHRLMQAAYGLVFYLRKTLLPYSLSPLYRLEAGFDCWSWPYLGSAVLVVGGALLLIWRARRWPWALVAVAVYAAVLFPVLGFFQSGEQIAADRYTYLACLPLAALVAGGVAQAWRRFSAGTLSRENWWSVVTLGLLLLAGLGWLTRRQTALWQNEFTLWSHALRLDPKHPTALHNLAVWHQNQGDLIKARTLFNASILLDPGNTTYGQGQGERRRRRSATAVLAGYNAALERNPGRVGALLQRGNLHQRMGNYDLARADYDAVIRLNPKVPEVYVNRGSLRARQGDFTNALRDLNIAIQLEPEMASAYNNRGYARMNLNESARALADYNTALALNPAYADAYFNRAIVHERLGQVAWAVRDCSLALRADPQWPHRQQAFQALLSLTLRQTTMTNLWAPTNR